MTVVLIVLRHEAGGGCFESIAVDNYSGSEDPEAGRRWISKSKQTMSAVGMRTMSTTRFLEGKQVHRFVSEGALDPCNRPFLPDKRRKALGSVPVHRRFTPWVRQAGSMIARG
jgi:hypothetical protein